VISLKRRKRVRRSSKIVKGLKIRSCKKKLDICSLPHGPEKVVMMKRSMDTSTKLLVTIVVSS
jgi:hypothetical protein